MDGCSDNEVRAQEKEVKARAGIVEARQRIRQAKYQVRAFYNAFNLLHRYDALFVVI